MGKSRWVEGRSRCGGISDGESPVRGCGCGCNLVRGAEKYFCLGYHVSSVLQTCWNDGSGRRTYSLSSNLLDLYFIFDLDFFSLLSGT